MFFLSFFSFNIYLLRLFRVLVAACGLLVSACMQELVPRPGIEPGLPALGVQSLTHWTTREVPPCSFNGDIMHWDKGKNTFKESSSKTTIIFELSHQLWFPCMQGKENMGI